MRTVIQKAAQFLVEGLGRSRKRGATYVGTEPARGNPLPIAARCRAEPLTFAFRRRFLLACAIATVGTLHRLNRRVRDEKKNSGVSAYAANAVRVTDLRFASSQARAQPKLRVRACWDLICARGTASTVHALELAFLKAKPVIPPCITLPALALETDCIPRDRRTHYGAIPACCLPDAATECCSRKNWSCRFNRL